MSFQRMMLVFLTPAKAMRARYLPLLMIYFAYGMTQFSSIAESFFVKEKLHLSAEALLAIGVWVTLPWTIKMVFGQLADCVPILGSVRRAYIFIAAGFMFFGMLMMAGLAGQWSWVMSMGSSGTIYLLANLFSVIGFVLQDVIADAMTVEVVPREGRSQEEINKELAMVQLLGRLSLSIALFLVAGLGGWLAQIFSYETMFLLALIIPFISISGALFIKTAPPIIKPINKVIFLGGILYAIFVILMGLSNIPYDQDIIFIVSLCIVVFFLFKLTANLNKTIVRNIMCAALVIFIFRATPFVGPSLQWWEIDVLGFNPAFFGTLSQISAALAIVGMWFFARLITEKPIGLIFITLTIVGTILTLPMIGMYYGLHIWTQKTFGFGAHAIALVDVALSSPFVQLSMVPMLALTARYAPVGNAATWFALMGSLMNLALTAGNLFSRHLNQIWVVTRGNYSQLGELLIVATVIGLLMPIGAVLLFLRDDLSFSKTQRE